MTGIYLFEAKSIQAYLGRAGKLRNVVEISNALAGLMDDSTQSMLFGVLEKAGLADLSDLAIFKPEASGNPKIQIRFTRAKGGAFYCWSDSPELLRKLRTWWLLFFQEAFPEMAYCDALVTDDDKDLKVQKGDFHGLLKAAFSALQQSASTSPVPFPRATAVVQSTPRTGSAAVRTKGGEYQDLPTVRIRQMLLSGRYDWLQYRLYDKALGECTDRDEVINCLKDTFDSFSRSRSENDIALIHLDGNGMGQILMKLREHLKDRDRDDYSTEMRRFSEMLEDVTIRAVQKATGEMLRRAGFSVDSPDRVPVFRPLVVGGDDLTVLVDPKYAYDFVIDYCREFRLASREAILKNELLKKVLEGGGLPPYLTASGGILFNKKSHPFFNSIRLVDGLAERAKKLTKLRPGDGDYTPEERRLICSELYGGGGDGSSRLYSAVAVFRMSTAAATLNVDSLISTGRTRTFTGSENTAISTGDCVYFVCRDEFADEARDRILTLEDIRDAVTAGDERTRSKIFAGLRQITGHMMNGDVDEWQREFRLMANRDYMKNVEELADRMNRWVYAWSRMNMASPDFGSDRGLESRFVRPAGKHDGTARKFSVLDDLIVAHHYISGGPLTKMRKDSQELGENYWDDEEI